jgi:type VI secretion system protein ImpK
MSVRGLEGAVLQRPATASETTQTGINELLGDSLNPLVQAATPLLLLAVQLRHSAYAPDLVRLREQAEAQVRKFEARVREARCSPESVMTARYVLCAALDEAVLNAPWGERSGWAQRTLLVTFHGEAYGGAKFFAILERLCEDVPRHIDLLELLYLCLAMGFVGRYQIEADGAARISAIQDDLHRRIRSQRGIAPQVLSPQWQGVQDQRHRLLRWLPLWVVASAAACVVLAVFVLLHARLNALSAPISSELAQIGLEAAQVPDSKRAAPTLRLSQLLAPEQRAGLLTVEDQVDGNARVRLNAAAMFASGGVDVDPSQQPLLAKIAAALDQLPGRVIVVGHTDDQAVRSLTYKDNFALSSARAQAVAQVLGDGLRDHARVESSGAGDSQPLARPTGLAANRARNRRVEILYQPGD